jgi:hypothetical protein
MRRRNNKRVQGWHHCAPPAMFFWKAFTHESQRLRILSVSRDARTEACRSRGRVDPKVGQLLACDTSRGSALRTRTNITTPPFQSPNPVQPHDRRLTTPLTPPTPTAPSPTTTHTTLSKWPLRCVPHGSHPSADRLCSRAIRWPQRKL